MDNPSNGNTKTGRKKLFGCVSIGCASLCVIVAVIIGWAFINMMPKKRITTGTNIKMYSQIEVDSIPETIYFSKEGRYLYILSDKNVWRYDILLGEKEQVERDSIPDPPPILTLPDDTMVHWAGQTTQWSTLKTEMEELNKKSENSQYQSKSKFIFSPTGRVSVFIDSISCYHDERERPRGPAASMRVYNISTRLDGTTDFAPCIASLWTPEHIVSDAVFSNDDRIIATLQEKGTEKEKIVAIWIIEDGSEIGSKGYPWTEE